MLEISQLRRLTFLLVIVLCSACSDHGYLMQSVKGHLDVMSRTRPIDEVLQANELTPEIRKQLMRVIELRTFAVKVLSLPDNGSYQDYADLERPYVVWNMVAAPELSLELNHWCYPIVGCVTYRGYFDESSARKAASLLEKSGFDVDVYGVQAYSTLNWFDDPVLNTFLRNDEIQLASLLFHEMAHQLVYVQGDPAFNESFAKTVELEGVRRWSTQNSDHHLWEECRKREELTSTFNGFLLDVRVQLSEVYESGMSNDDKRARKNEIIGRAYKAFAVMKNKQAGLSVYDDWLSSGLNNARLSSLAMYYDYVPAFNEILRLAEYDLPAFYDEVKSIASMEPHNRTQLMKSLAPVSKASTH